MTSTDTGNAYLLIWGIDSTITEITHAEAYDINWYMGANKDGTQISYSSPCSPSVGTHEYELILYALDETPSSLPTNSTLDVTLDVLLTAIDDVETISTTNLIFNSIVTE